MFWGSFGFCPLLRYNSSAPGVWPHCAAGSEVRNTMTGRLVFRRCQKCRAGCFQLQQAVAASCTKCPEHWQCDVDKLEMIPGTLTARTLQPRSSACVGCYKMAEGCGKGRWRTRCLRRKSPRLDGARRPGEAGAEPDQRGKGIALPQ